MYVRNTAGYNFSFRYRDVIIYIPFDGQIYSIPDDSRLFRELKVIPAMHIRTQKVIYINKDGTIASERISGHKRRGRPPKGEEKKKRGRPRTRPLAGVKLNVPKEVPKKEPTNENSIVDIDLDAIDDGEKVAPVKRKRGRPRKTVADAPTTPKKRGRPKKKTD